METDPREMEPEELLREYLWHERMTYVVAAIPLGAEILRRLERLQRIETEREEERTND
jgi:hypothetical protein